VSIAWLKQALWVNKPVRVLLVHGYCDGVFAGITSNGLLRVMTDDGERIFMAGEVQLRPLD
jgi:biotin-(acetyl-CoA carboxylase) ligase